MMRILIVGLGSIAKKHIEAIRKVKPTSIFYALRREDGAALENGIHNVTEISEISDIDFAIVSNPTSAHASTIAKLSELDIPLFIEKPLFDHVGHDILIQSILNKEIPTYVACNLRFLECLLYIKENIVGKRINEVNVYCGSYLPSWRPNVDFRKIYSANKEMGGGVHIDLIHEIDYIVWIFGAPEIVKKEFSNKSSLHITAYDYANYLMLYKQFSVNVVLNYYRRSSKREMEIVCEDGEYVVDLLKNKVRWNGKSVFESEQKISDTYIPQMNYFLKNVIDLKKPLNFNSILEAYKILKICLED